MTEKKKRSTLAKDLKKFERVGGSPTPMYQGERPGQPDPAVARAIQKRAEKASKKITVEMRLYLEAYAKKKNHADAWMVFHPTCPTMESARRRGWEFMRRIRERLTEDEIYDCMGLSREAITTAIADALGATSQRDFIMPKTGQIISTPPVPSHEVRLAAASLGVKVRRMIPDDEKGAAPITVNVISYVDPRTATPWPGGGRVVNGVLVNTVGPATLPLPKPDFTGGKGERDD